MSQDNSPFLNLPLELRIEIYFRALIQHQPEIPLRLKRSIVSLFQRPDGPIYTKRPEAFLITDASSNNQGPVLVCALALSQTSRQVRSEFSDFLRMAPVDIVTKVYNFDWSNTIDLIASLPKWRQDQFLVRQDGTAQSTLYLELGGPYYRNWRSNLVHWVDFVEEWASHSNAELKTLHKAIKDLASPDRRSFVFHGEVGCKLYPVYQSQRRGAGRLELDKIYFTFLGKYRAEIRMNSVCPTWEWDIVLEG